MNTADDDYESINGEGEHADDEDKSTTFESEDIQSFLSETNSIDDASTTDPPPGSSVSRSGRNIRRRVSTRIATTASTDKTRGRRSSARHQDPKTSVMKKEFVRLTSNDTHITHDQLSRISGPPYSCPFEDCLKTFSVLGYLESHLLNFHKLILDDTSKEEIHSLSDEDIMAMSILQSISSSNTETTTNNSIESSKLPCGFKDCMKSYKGLKYLQHHRQEIHNLHTCHSKGCLSYFETEEELTSHMSSAHESSDVPSSTKATTSTYNNRDNNGVLNDEDDDVTMVGPQDANDLVSSDDSSSSLASSVNQTMGQETAVCTPTSKQGAPDQESSQKSTSPLMKKQRLSHALNPDLDDEMWNDVSADIQDDDDELEEEPSETKKTFKLETASSTPGSLQPNHESLVDSPQE